MRRAKTGYDDEKPDDLSMDESATQRWKRTKQDLPPYCDEQNRAITTEEHLAHMISNSEIQMIFEKAHTNTGYDGRTLSVEDMSKLVKDKGLFTAQFQRMTLDKISDHLHHQLNILTREFAVRLQDASRVMQHSINYFLYMAQVAGRETRELRMRYRQTSQSPDDSPGSESDRKRAVYFTVLDALKGRSLIYKLGQCSESDGRIRFVSYEALRKHYQRHHEELIAEQSVVHAPRMNLQLIESHEVQPTQDHPWVGRVCVCKPGSLGRRTRCYETQRVRICSARGRRIRVRLLDGPNKPLTVTLPAPVSDESFNSMFFYPPETAGNILSSETKTDAHEVLSETIFTEELHPISRTMGPDVMTIPESATKKRKLTEQGSPPYCGEQHLDITTEKRLAQAISNIEVQMIFGRDRTKTGYNGKALSVEDMNK